MINVNDMSKEQLWKLREEIVLGSLFTGNFENSYDIDPKAVQDFFDAFIEDCILQMTEKGMSADDAWDAFVNSGDWDNAEKLYDYYLSIEYPFGDFEVEKIEESIVMNENASNPDFELIEDKLLDIPYTSKVEFDYRPYDDVYKNPEDHFIVLVFNNDNFGYGSDYIINSIRWKKNVINTLKELGWKLEDPLEDNGSYLYLVMEKIKPEAKTEGYDITSSILPNSDIVGHVEVYSDYETAKSRALMLGLKEAEYGDEFGSDISYCAWNKSGDRNEEAEVLAYYKFENGKPVALTDEEKATVERVKELTFDDITGPIEEKLTIKESSLQKDEFIISDTERLSMGWEKGYNGGSFYVEKIYLPSKESEMWSTEFHKTYATEEAARRAFNRYKKQYSLTEDTNSSKQATVQ